MVKLRPAKSQLVANLEQIQKGTRANRLSNCFGRFEQNQRMKVHRPGHRMLFQIFRESSGTEGLRNRVSPSRTGVGESLVKTQNRPLRIVHGRRQQNQCLEGGQKHPTPAWDLQQSCREGFAASIQRGRSRLEPSLEMLHCRLESDPAKPRHVGNQAPENGCPICRTRITSAKTSGGDITNFDIAHSMSHCAYNAQTLY